MRRGELSYQIRSLGGLPGSPSVGELRGTQREQGRFDPTRKRATLLCANLEHAVTSQKESQSLSKPEPDKDFSAIDLLAMNDDLAKEGDLGLRYQSWPPCYFRKTCNCLAPGSDTSTEIAVPVEKSGGRSLRQLSLRWVCPRGTNRG